MKIKKLLAILLALTFAFSCFSVIPFTAAAMETQNLQNTYHRLAVDKELTIGYIGGSVTAGTGATNAATDSWRALTTSWFKTQFPDATITEKNMAIGGHGTVFALYRMERALLDLEGDLDFVFIETAVNDNYDGTEGDTLRRYMESIINKIYAKNPKCNIVMVITGNVSTMSTAHKTGVAFRGEHRDVAAHYGIPVIDAGATLYEKIYKENFYQEITSESNSVWKKYFQDSVHPINAGYKVYADTIKDYLASELVEKSLDSSVYADITMPAAPLMSNLLISAYDVDFSSFPFDTASHFTTKTYSPTNNAVSYKKLMSSNEGETFTVKFNGTSFGLWTWSYNTKTVISYSVDGGSKKTKEIYRSSSNHKAYTLVEGLKEGEHTITITHEDAAATFELYSMFITGNSATVTSAGYVGDNTATENVDNAIFIDKAVDKLPVNVFYPVSIKDADGVTLSGDVMLRLQFKCKMLSGTMPIIGWLRTDATTNTSNTYAEQNWVDNESTDSDGDGLYTTYDAQAGIFTAYIKVSSWYKHGRDSDSGERYGYLTIGNMEHNGDWHHTYDYNASFIMSQPELKVYDPATGTVGTTNLIGDFRDAHVDFKGTYHQESQGTNQWNSPYFASANKWHIDSSPAYIKQVKVPSDFNTSENYSDANFVKTAETDYTREYYTNDNYSGLYFEKLDETNGGYAIVEDLNKKVIIIGANHEGEDDNRTTDGYKPTKNRKANIFIPISLWQYGGAVDDKVAATPENQYIVKVTVKAKILEGEGYPVLGRICSYKTGTDGKGSRAEGKMAKNMHLSGYYSDSSHEKYYDTNGNLLSYSYNPETEELVGYLRMKSGDSTYRSRWGQTEILTIGNAENVWAPMTYDTTEFNSSFAISDVKVDVYKAQSHSGGGYDMVSLLAEDIVPDFVAENIDTTSTYQYKHKKSSDDKTDYYSNHSNDVVRASQKLWQVDGATSLVSSYNLTECFDKHTLTHHEATDTTREYYACSCGKNYADKAATVEIDDITAKKQMIVINSAGEKTAQVAIPLDLRGFTGTKYFKFTTKLKTFGADAEPNVQVFLARREGQVGGATVDGDTKVVSTSYNKATGEFSAIIAIWHQQVRDTYYDYFYDEPNTGADCLITIGNMTHVGNGGKDNKYYSTFAIADPELYRITSATDETKVDGVNLMTDITDKTVVLDNNYAMLDWTGNYFSNKNTPMSAPLNTWVRYGTGTSKIAVADIPAGFFEGEKADANMLAIYGSGNQHAVTYETFLEPGETYLFDIDYKAYGGVKALINPQTAGTGSYATIEGATDDGSHYSAQFTMPADARKSYAGNFKLYLGQKWPAKASGSVYFANASIRKIEGAGPGENILLNGDFNYGNGEVITEGNYSEALPFWNKDDILNYAKAQTINIPENFFTADAKETKDTAIHFKGGDWHELQFFAQLEANTTYRLSYNYRAFGDMPTLIQRGGTGSVVINKLSDVLDGEYLQTYEIVTSADKSAGDIGNANTRFGLTFGTQSYDKELYISNVKLYKVVDGETVGLNILGDLNPIIDDSLTGAVSLGQDVATAMRRDIARGWLANFGSDKNVEQFTAVEKVADDFYTFIPYAERLINLRKVLLGNEIALDMSKYDAVSDDELNLLDLVRMKKYSAGVGNNGAEGSSDALYNKIMKAPNTETKGTVYYVSNDGKDSNAGTSASAPLATITKANSKAKSGDTILLNRGDMWRAVANSENSYVAKSGVTYGAYGEGDKPLVLGSAKDYTTATWTNVSGNIWKTQISSDAHDGNRVGNIYFFASANDEEPTIIGRVVRDGQRFASYNDLIEEGDVYSDITDSWFGNDKGTVYVYCEGNPATKYGRIEIAEKREVFILESGATFDNIAIKYAGGHAINATNVKNVTVTNCEIGYVGGAPLNAEIYGNGIQFGLGAENIVVKNNYVYQCCDAGITFQSWGVSGTNDDTEFKNITFADNLLTNNYYNIEFFTTGTSDYKLGANNAGNGKFTDIYITGNIMRFAGECWSATQRMDSADGTGTYRAANICVTQDAYYVNTSNLNIKNNIFDCTVSSHVYWTWDDVTANVDKTAHVGLNVEGNTFYQKSGAVDNRTMMFGNTSSYSYASSQYGLENAVALFDKNPAKVAWLDSIVF